MMDFLTTESSLCNFELIFKIISADVFRISCSIKDWPWNAASVVLYDQEVSRRKQTAFEKQFLQLNFKPNASKICQFFCFSPAVHEGFEEIILIQINILFLFKCRNPKQVGPNIWKQLRLSLQQVIKLQLERTDVLKIILKLSHIGQIENLISNFQVNYDHLPSPCQK